MDIAMLLERVRKDLPIEKKEDRIALIFYYRKHIIEFIEAVIKLDEIGSTIPFKMYTKQKEYVEAFLKYHYILTLKSRQIGLSTVTQAIIATILTLWPNVFCGVISKDGTEATKFAKKTKNMIENMPKWIRPKFDKSTEQNFILTNKSELQTATVNAHKPTNTHRGASIALLVVDEGAFIDKIEEAYYGLMPSVSKVHKVAESKGIPYGTFIISTPNKTTGIGAWYYNTYINALAGKNKFHVQKIHWTQIEGCDEEWYKDQCKLLDNDRNVIAQELDMKFVATDASVFDDVIQAYLQDENNFPKYDTVKINVNKYDDQQHFELKADCELFVYKHYDEDKEYLIGIDIATKRGECFTSICVCEAISLEIAAVYFGSINTLLLSELIKRIADLYPTCLIIPERNSYGETTADELHYSKDYSSRLFYTKKELKNSTEYIPGLLTTRLTRPLIVESFITYTKENYFKINSYILALQLIGLEDKNGKIKHGNGSKDDLVMAFGFCCYVRMYGLMVPHNKLSRNEKESLSTLFLDGASITDDQNKKGTGPDGSDWTDMFIY